MGFKPAIADALCLTRDRVVLLEEGSDVVNDLEQQELKELKTHDVTWARSMVAGTTTAADQTIDEERGSCEGRWVDESCASGN